MTGIGVPHTDFATVQLGGRTVEYNPENPAAYVYVA